MISPSRTTSQTYINIGVNSTPGSVGSFSAYQNIGLEKTLPVAIVRQPRGWGFIPNTSQTVMVLAKSSRAVATTHIEIVES